MINRIDAGGVWVHIGGMTYADECRARDKDRDEFIQKMKGIDLPGWLVSMRHEHLLQFQHEETGAIFCVGTPKGWGADRHKVEAFMFYPRDENNRSMSARDWGLCKYDESDPNRIGFTSKKSAGAIAKDLQRRLIPGVLASHAVICAEIDRRASAGETMSVVTDTVAAAFDTDDIRDREYYSARIVWGGWKNSAKLRRHNDSDPVTIDLELGDLTLDQTLAIAAILKGGQS